MTKQEIFLKYYKEEKEKLNKIINDYNEKIKEDSNELVKENLELFSNLNSDGKLVRGILVNLGYYLLKDNKDYSKYLSLSYEVAQTAILTHDDIIDNDPKRRGKDTIHYANYNKYKKYSEEAKHLSESIAICIGDYGLYDANRIIAEYYCDDKNLAKVITNFNQTILTTIRGELIDVILPFQSKYNLIDTSNIEENIMEIYRLKTSHYTIIGPLSIGLLLAGGTEEMISDIEKFGEKVGIAFQIQDDILGIFSNEMQKNKDSDIKEFKQTVLYSYVINTDYKDEFMKYYGNESLAEKDIETVKDILIKSKAYDYAINMMNDYYDEGIKLLNEISWIKEDKKILIEGFIEYLRNRKK